MHANHVVTIGWLQIGLSRLRSSLFLFCSLLLLYLASSDERLLCVGELEGVNYVGYLWVLGPCLFDTLKRETSPTAHL